MRDVPISSHPEDNVVNVMLLPSATSGVADAVIQFATSFVIDGSVALDAGCLGYYGSPSEQARIRHVVLSHSHADHVSSLPLFVENAYDPRLPPIQIHASADVLACLERDLFNGRIWPDLACFTNPERPFFTLHELHPGQTTTVAHLRFTPIPVHHTVPTFGFLVQDGRRAIVFSSDTGPTDELWRRANACPDLAAVFLEASFPDFLRDLADLSRHLTPSSFLREVKKLDRDVPIFAVHIKPNWRERTIAELHALGLRQLHVAVPGRICEF
jgi:ribonuclease BN (tRNA processing enzyme)